MPPKSIYQNPRIDILKRNVYADKKNPSPPLTYNDMLNNMGVKEKDGNLYSAVETQNKYTHNSYIYNKYFKDYIKEEQGQKKPKDIYEYRNMLIRQIIENYKNKKIKSTKIIIPTNNYNNSSGFIEENKWFDFSKR